jgi:hypothetical protein
MPEARTSLQGTVIIYEFPPMIAFLLRLRYSQHNTIDYRELIRKPLPDEVKEAEMDELFPFMGDKKRIYLLMVDQALRILQASI